VTGYEEASAYFDNDIIWEADHHIFAKDGTAGPIRPIELTDVVRQLRFVGKHDRLRVEDDGTTNPQQLQTMRQLTDSTADLLDKFWIEHGDPTDSPDGRPVKTVIPEEVETPEKYLEGAVKTITVNAYERNRYARSKCIEHYGWACAVCGYYMAELYGKLGDGVIHVHHLRELASLGEEYEVDPIKDLRPVCPNCHAILHNFSPAMTIEKLRKALAGRKPVRWPTKIK
jgi:hypothetical protein